MGEKPPDLSFASLQLRGMLQWNDDYSGDDDGDDEDDDDDYGDDDDDAALGGALKHWQIKAPANFQTISPHYLCQF